MPATPAMHTLQSRVDSFKKTKRVKRYPSKKTSTQAASVKWPHPASYKANANTLAEAGFFFSPSWDDRDCVACFLCGKELSDWDAEDDPFAIHHEKCADVCGWAVVRCGLVEDMDEDGNFTFVNKARIPTTKVIEEARLKTFGEDWWPHDEDANHGANSRKMAQAGFVYTPQSVGDDTVTCLYCNLALGGWDKGDDPIHEHRKRATKSADTCPFFSFFSQPGPPTKLGRSESTRGKKGTASSQKQTRGHSRTRSRKEEKAEKKEKEEKQKVEPKPQPAPAVPPDPPMIVVGEEVPDPSSPPPIPSTPRTIPAPAMPTPAPAPMFPTPVPAVPTPETPSPVPAPNPTPDTPMVVEDNIFYNPPVPILPPSSEALTAEERELSVEQWIRREISLSYDKLLADGQRQIHLFKEKSAEIRRRIDEL